MGEEQTTQGKRMRVFYIYICNSQKYILHLINLERMSKLSFGDKHTACKRSLIFKHIISIQEGLI